MTDGVREALILLDDRGGRLGPLTDLRASFELRTGALTTEERIAARLGRAVAGLIVPDELAPLLGSRRSEPINRLPDGESFVVVNGRSTALGTSPPERPNAAVLDEDGSLITARLDRSNAEALLRAGGRAEALREPTGPGEVSVDPPKAGQGGRGDELQLLRRPWDLLNHARVNLPGDLELLAGRLRPLEASEAARVTVVGEHPVLVGKGTTIHPQVVIDTSAGPVALDDGAEVRSMSVLVGPGYVGRGTVITNHAHIRGRCVIGPVCKVGGEVNASIFQGYANKAHAGYLGDSFVGEWANLGAGTTTSNLKNTYGEIRTAIEPDGEPEPTGMRNLGAIIGDHVKTAIGTRLLSGSCLHTGAMLALSGFAPKRVDRFAFLADDPAAGSATAPISRERRYEFEKFCAVAEHVMGRRDHGFSAELRQRLETLYAG